ncbi:MAG: ABC transporter permease subunit, partial [Planctomycetota bacterium]
IGLIVAVVALLITYGVCRNEKCLDEDFAHITYALMFIVIGSIFNMVLSASCITSEKETRSWPILLATSMDDWYILLGKAVGVFRRCLPFWLFLAGHVAFFISVRYIHPIALPHLFMLVSGLVVFLTGTGIYFSTRFKHTTSAVVASFGLALFLWAVVPMLLGFLMAVTRDGKVLETYLCANPATQVTVIMGGAAGKWNARDTLSALDYNWPNNRWDGVGATTGVLFAYMLMYISVGLFFAWRAKRLFRRRIF